MVGVPEITPVAASTLSPGGSVPPSENVRTALGEESVATTVIGVMVSPATELVAPGPVTVMVLETCQVKVADPLNPAESVTVTVTG